MILNPIMNKLSVRVVLKCLLRVTNPIIKICIISLLVVHLSKADSTIEWMTTSIEGLKTLFQCIEVPEFNNFNNGSQTLNLATAGQWVATGNKVQKGKMIKFSWNNRGLESRPRKYLVLYRIDPRFARPQIFIQTYDYNTGKYLSDFHHFRDGQLLKYQLNRDTVFQQQLTDYTNYFNFVGRKAIQIYKGDVVNITLAKAGDFFAAASEFQGELYGANVSQYLTAAYTYSLFLNFLTSYSNVHSTSLIVET